jgi:uncharacterized protein YidB (DUF937 family)
MTTNDQMSSSRLGRSLADMRDPFELEVRWPVEHWRWPQGLPMLPKYVDRPHDDKLAEVVRAAARRTSRIAVLVGGPSTGKTRACWEALTQLRDLPDPWRLWHPIAPSRPEALLRGLPSIGPFTVVWLNEAQSYLGTSDGTGERVVAELRKLLRDQTRRPVLVLAALRPEFWRTLTARPSAEHSDPHEHARELLSGREITVPSRFTPDLLRVAARSADPRLAHAAAAAPDGRVIQFLADARVLLALYNNAPPTAWALISAAMDARRLGMGTVLPLRFLEAAVPGYLNDDEWDGPGDNWLEQALDYTAADVNGSLGALIRIRPRPSRGNVPASGPAYRLADYLDQHGRQSRRSCMPPAEFWVAAADHVTDPGHLAALARAAEERGLLQDAARLRKRAVALGGASAAAALVVSLHSLYPDDTRPAGLGIEHAALDDPTATAELLSTLQRIGATEHVTALLARDPAGKARLDNPDATTKLLSALQRAEAAEQVKALAKRAAAKSPVDAPAATATLLDALRQAGAGDQIPSLLARDPAGKARLDNPDATARLLTAIWAVGAAEQVKALAKRAAAKSPVDNPTATAELLSTLRLAGAADQVIALAKRAAADTPLNDLSATVRLLDTLRRMDAAEQVKGLAKRAAEDIPLDNPWDTATLLDALGEAGTADEVATLLARDPAGKADPDNPSACARLLSALQRAGAADQVKTLIAHAAAHCTAEDPAVCAWVLDRLWEAGTADQVTTLVARDPARRARLDNPDATARLLNALQRAGATDQVKTLATRAAEHIPLGDPSDTATLLDALRQAGAADQVETLTAQHPLDDPRGTAILLDALGEAGATDQVTALLARDPAGKARLDNPDATARLLNALQHAGATDQVTALLARAAADTPLDDPSVTAWVLGRLRAAAATDQVTVLLARDPAGKARLDDPSAAAKLLDALQAADAADQVTALLARDPAGKARLDNPDATARLVNALQHAGAARQVRTLASRAADRTPLDDPSAVAKLLNTLRAAGVSDLADVFTKRLPAHGLFDLIKMRADYRALYKFGCQPDGQPASAWAWSDLE